MNNIKTIKLCSCIHLFKCNLFKFYFDITAVAGRSDKIFRMASFSLWTEACRQSSDLKLEIVKGFPVESASEDRLEPTLKLICTFEPFKPKSLTSDLWCKLDVILLIFFLFTETMLLLVSVLFRNLIGIFDKRRILKFLQMFRIVTCQHFCQNVNAN